MTFRHFTISLALLATACSGSKSADQGTTPTALVKTAIAQTGAVAASQAVYGAVLQNADTQFTLAAPVEAIVSRIAAPVGSPVRRGSLVVELAPSPASRAEIARRSAEARSAQQAYERTQRLRADGLASDADVESARAAAQAAKASETAITSQAGALALRAPGAGYVQSIASNPGDLVGAGTPIATISRSGNLRAQFGVDPDLLSRLSRSAGVRLISADGAAGGVARIVAVDPTADPQTRLSSIYVALPPSLAMGTGQPLRGEITLERSGKDVVVPYAALLNDASQPYVFVVTKGVAHRHDVMIGASDGTTVAITSGVSAGDQVVTEGGTALEDGMKVRTR